LWAIISYAANNDDEDDDGDATQGDVKSTKKKMLAVRILNKHRTSKFNAYSEREKRGKRKIRLGFGFDLYTIFY
jgi:hypothetical protein